MAFAPNLLIPMQFFKTSALFLAATAALCLTGCKKDQDVAPTGVGTVAIEFENVVGGAPLDLGQSKAAYRTAAGDSFRVTKFLYYVSNINFTRSNGEKYAVPNTYFLVNEADAGTHSIKLSGIPAADYNSLTFTVGVDSLRNVSGAQTGALDPSNAMFWSWNSGYIFLKLEGNFVQPGTRTEGGLVFHIGGFRTPNNTIRTVTLPMMPSGTLLAVRSDHSPEVHVQADVLKMFDGTAANAVATPQITFNDRPTGRRIINTMGGPNSVLVANNYARAGGMFVVEHVHAN